MMKKVVLFGIIFALYISCGSSKESNSKVVFTADEANKKMDVSVNGKYFTSLIYPDDMEKPVLYPIITVSGKEITRGYPLNPRPFERTDHPHHVGLWFSFGDVNGLDFWNNSFAIKPEDKPRYGSIKFRKIEEMDPKSGKLVTTSDWVDFNNNVLLNEKTTYFFGENDSIRTIERITELIARQQVTFTENKEGLIGMRMDRAFEEPSDKPEKFLDAQGNVTEVPVLNNEGVNGVYRNAEGLKGGDVWGKRSRWVALRAEKEGEVITVVILDHPQNPNYPGWSHARGYGLFAHNNLAGKAVDKGGQPVKLELQPGEKIVFKHKVVIGGDLADERINTFSADFVKE
jgi:hypothetical protein